MRRGEGQEAWPLAHANRAWGIEGLPVQGRYLSRCAYSHAWPYQGMGKDLAGGIPASVVTKISLKVGGAMRDVTRP